MLVLAISSYSYQLLFFFEQIRSSLSEREKGDLLYLSMIANRGEIACRVSLYGSILNGNPTRFTSVALVLHAPGSPTGHKKVVCNLSLDHQSY